MIGSPRTENAPRSALEGLGNCKFGTFVHWLPSIVELFLIKTFSEPLLDKFLWGIVIGPPGTESDSRSALEGLGNGKFGAFVH